MNSLSNAVDPSRPVSAFPKQAIVVIHGMGEQVPMDTLRGFVRAVWETDTEITKNGLPNPAEVWSKPDLRTGSLELRRITTRQSIPTQNFAKGVRSDFYEMYWADLSSGSTLGQVEDWIRGLLLRNPFTRVPRDVFLAWCLLWILTLVVLTFAIATTLPAKAALWGIRFWDYPPLSWLSDWQSWQLALATGFFGFVLNGFVVPYFGRVVRYTRATPDNIAARKNIRERGLALLSDLHNGDYDRVIIVGHSLGSILAYDLISYFWATRTAPRTVVEGTPEFAALRDLEQVLKDTADLSSQDAAQKFDPVRRAFCRALRSRPRPAAGAVDGRWLITDLVTLGSPLGHADFLLAKSAKDLAKRRADRDLPTSPPLRELLDPEGVPKAKAAGLPIDPERPQLLCFPFGSKGEWQLHHAAPFAAVRWTNVHDPARLVFFGDVISSPVARAFGSGVMDIDLRAERGQSLRFSHTRYWWMPKSGGQTPKHVEILRRVLDLAGTRGF